MIKIVSVKFKGGGKSYYFAPNANEKYEKGMGVIVETSKGLEYATVVQPEGEVEESEIVTPLKPVVRIATARDEETVKRNKERRGEAMKTAQEKIAERGLEMKLVDCEFAFDGNKVVFYFTSETRVDFRELIKDLSSAFHSRIELRQISIRDEIKLTGGLAPCGRECCCIGCMSEPLKVSVKMAKNQGLSLNPGKISGLCGRLMCCLAYENDYYSEACKKVPKVGSEAETPDGKGTVVNVNMLKMQVKVKIEQNDSVTYHDYGVDEIRFMRGNVVMGKEDLETAEDKQEITVPAEQPAHSESEPNNGRRDKNKGRDRNGNGQGNDKRPNRENREGRDNRDKNRNNGNNGDENREKRQEEGRNRNRNNRDRRGERKEGERREGNENSNQRENRENNAPRNNETRNNEGGKNFKNKRRRRHGNKPNGGAGEGSGGSAPQNPEN